jgi:hypothetical protein
MTSDKLEFIPNNILRKQFYENLILSLFILLMFFIFPRGNLFFDIFHWIFLFYSITLFLSALLLIYSDLCSSPYYPIFRIYKEKVELYYPRLNNNILIITKKDITKVSGFIIGKFPVIGIKFKDYKKFLEKYPIKPIKRNIISILSIYHFLKKNEVPVKFSQFFSKSISDQNYIDLAISDYNEKKMGYHMIFYQAYYAPRKLRSNFKNILFRKSDELVLHLKKSLTRYTKNEVVILSKENAKLNYSIIEKINIRLITYLCLVVVFTYAYFIDVSGVVQMSKVFVIINGLFLSLIIVGFIELIYQIFKSIRKKFYAKSSLKK